MSVTIDHTGANVKQISSRDLGAVLCAHLGAAATWRRSFPSY